MQVKVERTGTDPVQARITIRSGPDGVETAQEVTDVAQATAMTDAIEAEDKLGVWRGPGDS